MIPPVLRRCPACGYLGATRRFEAVGDGLVECPACGHRFERIDDPALL